eukprot:TRINITY_DN21097_c0_g1_i1.p1 TRINITY_DN21097_c0_g1~~TRINITY_DN21097_c0_g1_i1.p1  ORF type:complete len:207 (+),score=32.76 TRINITY_DN21097_c0_g1_i1:41-661(+)
MFPPQIRKTGAVMTNNLALLKTAIDEGDDLQVGDGQAALRLACRSNIEMVKLLVEHGATVNYEDCSECSTPLLSACYGGCTDIVSYLLDKGATVNYRDELGSTPLTMNISSSHPKAEVVDALLKAGADPNTQDADNKPALQLAKEAGLAAIVELLKQSGAKDDGSATAPAQPPPDKHTPVTTADGTTIYTSTQIADKFLHDNHQTN